MKRKYQMIHMFALDSSLEKGDRKNAIIGTEKSSFATLENAIEKAHFWIEKKADWIAVTTFSVIIVDKETYQIVWEWNLNR